MTELYNHEYDYQCPHCEAKDESLAFQELKQGQVRFFCRYCSGNFITADREKKFIHAKLLSLQKRYPR